MSSTEKSLEPQVTDAAFAEFHDTDVQTTDVQTTTESVTDRIASVLSRVFGPGSRPTRRDVVTATLEISAMVLALFKSGKRQDVESTRKAG
jgi:hypothetical protein